MKGLPIHSGLSLLFSLLITACDPPEEPQAIPPAPVEIAKITTGTAADRISQIAPVLSIEPPSNLQDAYFIEERIGDNSRLTVPGPSDYHSFYRLEVEPVSVDLWRQALVPLATDANYAVPTEPQDWWLTPAQFDQLEFYQPDGLTQRIHGWVGILPETGDIYIYTFTM
ncbi:MAG: hypothetical protein AAF921_12470 [Cyanobacteria bacterium P01_D01_bin.44]